MPEQMIAFRLIKIRSFFMVIKRLSDPCVGLDELLKLINFFFREMFFSTIWRISVCIF